MLRETGWLLLVQAVLWVRPHYLQQNCLLSKCNQNNLEEIYPGFGGGAQRFGGGAQGFGGGTGFGGGAGLGGGAQGFGGGTQGFGDGAQGFVGGAPGFAGGAPFGPNIFSSSFIFLCLLFVKMAGIPPSVSEVVVSIFISLCTFSLTCRLTSI